MIYQKGSATLLQVLPGHVYNRKMHVRSWSAVNMRANLAMQSQTDSFTAANAFNNRTRLFETCLGR